MKLSHIPAAIIAASLIAGCSGKPSWSVSGHITDADSMTLVLEATSNGTWHPLDSATLDSDGKFKFTQEAPRFPGIYRLNLAGRHIYFPIDSLEEITVSASAPEFGSRFTLDGSQAARMTASADSMIYAALASRPAKEVVSDSLLKRTLATRLLEDPAGIAAYYIISKKVDGLPLFNPEVKSDLRIIGAVANAYDNMRPDDPRAPFIKNMFLSHRPAAGTTMEAGETGLFDITLFDDKGRSHSLLETSKQGKVIILNFTSYTAQPSTAFNNELMKIWNRYGSSKIEIFQVAVDDDEYAWRRSARNLPWTTVYMSQADDARVLMSYNVTELPTTFIIDRNGELVERIDDITKASASISRYL